jgi:hypothetical protein
MPRRILVATVALIAVAAVLPILAAPVVTASAVARACDHYGPTRIVGTVRNDTLDEISGLASSKRHHGALWVVEDSGNGPFVSALTPRGRLRARIKVGGAENQDWEAMAVAGGNVWIGDIGDNALARASTTLYWFGEPRLRRARVAARSATMTYPGRASHNAEAMIVDARREQLYIFTKASTSLVFRAGIADLRDGDRLRLERVFRLPFENVTGADLGRPGIIVKGYTRGQVFRWTRSRRVSDALRHRWCAAPVGGGEAIGFDRGGRGHYTIPEGTLPDITYVG